MALSAKSPAESLGSPSASRIFVRQAAQSDAEDWNDYVSGATGAELYHRYEWRGFLESVFGHKCIYLVARDMDEQVRGVLPLVQIRNRLFGNFLVSLPCFNYAGTLTSDDRVRESLIESARLLRDERGASHVELRHRGSIRLEAPSRTDKVSMELALPTEPGDLWKSFSSKLRAQIRRPQKEQAVCQDGGEELVNDFYDVFSRNMRDLGTPVYPKRYFAELCRRFPDQSRIFVVYLHNKAVAAGITLGYRNVLEIPSASSLREFNKFSPNMLMYWSALEYGIHQGYRVFDFGRSTLGSGTYRFKRQWGAVETPLSWHYLLRDERDLPQLNPDNPRFRAAIRAWQRLPVPVANWLGPHIVKRLP